MADRPQPRLAALAARVGALRGFRRWLLALGLGALGALGLPPFNLVPVLVPAFVGLLWLLGGCPSWKAAAGIGWTFGFGQFLVSLYWVSNALLVDPERFLWLLPIIASGLPALLAVFPALACVAVRLARPPALLEPLVLAGAWVIAEWLRGHVLTGFPWSLVGHAWTFSDAMLQSASVGGSWWLSLATVFAAAAPAAFRDPRARAAWPTAAAALLLAAMWGFGAVRLSAPPAPDTEGIRLRIVQANIAQTLKWEPAERLANFRKHLELSRSPGWEQVTTVIWPETAVPFLLTETPGALGAIAEVVPPGGAVITGGVRVARGPDGQPTSWWNSVYAVDRTGTVRATSDKFHLVPLGEYVPLRRWLPMPSIAGGVDFSAGPGPRTIEAPGVPPFGTLVCYEVIFPGAVAQSAHRPAWLLNVTNDGWYGRTAGPYQHFAIARLRSVEEGLPLVRAANTGISAVIDAYGRVRARLALGETGVLDSPLPPPLSPTFYSRYGDLPAMLAALLFYMTFVLRRLPIHRTEDGVT